LEPQAPAPVLSFCNPCTDDAFFKKNIRSLDDVLKSNYKMKINRKKTGVMVCSKDPENINIKMDDNALKQVPKFKYRQYIYRRWEK